VLFQGVHYSIDAALYHSDPCPDPSLSTSIAKVIWQESPKHAWEKHPRLNLNFEPEHKRIFDIGAAAHALLLENDIDRFDIIYADNYKTKKAQQERKDAYNFGMIPVLERELDQVVAMTTAAAHFIMETELAGILSSGISEVTLAEFSSGFWKRCRLDWLTFDRSIILDYKTTGGSSKPESWIRTQLFPMSYDIQAYTYPHILSKIEGCYKPQFVWLVQETKRPYTCSLIGASPAVTASGRSKWRYATHKWKWCLEHGKWPAHDSRIHWADVPVWTMLENEERSSE
jgi:hypothetical protein